MTSWREFMNDCPEHGPSTESCGCDGADYTVDKLHDDTTWVRRYTLGACQTRKQEVKGE